MPGAQPRLDTNRELVRPGMPIGTLVVCTEQKRLIFGAKRREKKWVTFNR